MNFYCTQHQHKARAYVQALLKYGHDLTCSMRCADFFLLDFTVHGLWAGSNDQHWRLPVIRAIRDQKPLFLYPHSARPNMPFDLQKEFCASVDAVFTFSEGHKRVLELLGYPHPVEVSGWTYTKILKFRPVPKSRKKIKVLLAPIHPLDQWLPDDEKEMNRRIYQTLLELVGAGAIDLTVRYLYRLKDNWIFQDERVNFIQGSPSGNMRDALAADVIIAAYSFAYSSVALGKPLVMMGESLRPHNTPRNNGKLIFGKNWESYRDYMRFPYNADEALNKNALMEQIENAAHNEPAEWKKTFIGEPFKARRFVKTLESYL